MLDRLGEELVQGYPVPSMTNVRVGVKALENSSTPGNASGDLLPFTSSAKLVGQHG